MTALVPVEDSNDSGIQGLMKKLQGKEDLSSQLLAQAVQSAVNEKKKRKRNRKQSPAETLVKLLTGKKVKKKKKKKDKEGKGRLKKDPGDPGDSSEDDSEEESSSEDEEGPAQKEGCKETSCCDGDAGASCAGATGSECRPGHRRRSGASDPWDQDGDLLRVANQTLLCREQPHPERAVRSSSKHRSSSKREGAADGGLVGGEVHCLPYGTDGRALGNSQSDGAVSFRADTVGVNLHDAPGTETQTLGLVQKSQGYTPGWSWNGG